jgi:hypothetical protein
MANVDALAREYERLVRLRWESHLSGAERVWCAVYAKEDERRLRARLAAFEAATARAGHGWREVDLTDAFAHWMADHRYRDSYFASPDLLTGGALNAFRDACIARVREALAGPGVDGEAVVALYGVASLFGFARVSAIIETVAEDIQGRLLVFFPGEHEGNNYRLLDARDGWNYRATPIMAREGAGE